jgi:ABC-type methionine transport system ATPase subunit
MRQSIQSILKELEEKDVPAVDAENAKAYEEYLKLIIKKKEKRQFVLKTITRDERSEINIIKDKIKNMQTKKYGSVYEFGFFSFFDN